MDADGLCVGVHSSGELAAGARGSRQWSGCVAPLRAGVMFKGYTTGLSAMLAKEALHDD